MVRFVLKFNKGEAVRWLGHLDLVRAFERIIMRAKLPVAYSLGFNPRAKISFLSALSCGFTGGEEIITLEMAEDVEPTELMERMNQQMPGGFKVIATRKIAEGEPKSLRLLGSEFLVEIRQELGLDVSDIEMAVSKLLSLEDIAVVRSKSNQTKTMNIRAGIESIEVADSLHLSMRLTHGERFTVKPSEVVTALAEYLPGLEIENVHRVRMY